MAFDVRKKAISLRTCKVQTRSSPKDFSTPSGKYGSQKMTVNPKALARRATADPIRPIGRGKYQLKTKLRLLSRQQQTSIGIQSCRQWLGWLQGFRKLIFHQGVPSNLGLSLDQHFFAFITQNFKSGLFNGRNGTKMNNQLIEKPNFPPIAVHIFIF